ncbi:MAG TPA: PrpF domain-containing protein, partial [Dehalococcoidia bacterium]|nr:PrpF domain-containing protein [Dehalococcoidia bacterium]
TGHEPVEELGRDAGLKERLRAIWVAAGLAMGLRKPGGEAMTADDLARSETIPKVCLIAEPAGDEHITARYFTPQTPHNSLAVTGGCCLAVACLIPETVAHRVARGIPKLSADERAHTLAMRNPAGVLRARVAVAATPDGLRIGGVAYERSTQIFLRGHFPLYEASADLRRWGERWPNDP